MFEIIAKLAPGALLAHKTNPSIVSTTSKWTLSQSGIKPVRRGSPNAHFYSQNLCGVLCKDKGAKEPLVQLLLGYK